MSGPIIRKYGFPNFEKIFGERPLEHGADGDEEHIPAEPTQEENAAGPASKKSAGKKKSSGPKKA